MNRPPTPESRLTAWLEGGPPTGPDELLSRAYARTRSTRQRPAWLIALRGDTMETTWRAFPLPLARPALLLLISLLILALAAGAFAVGSGLLSTEAARTPGIIAFDAEGEIWLANDDGTGLTRLTETTASEANPVFSPDGGRIAYSLVTDGATTGLAVMAADGTPERTLELPVGLTQPSFPVWSPQGALAVRAWSDVAGKGVIVRWDTTSAKMSVGHRLDLPIGAGDLSWSPDGATIAFQVTDEQGLETLYAVAPDGTNLRRLAPEGRWASFWPADRYVFTPDARSVAFQLEADGGTDGDVAIVDVTGGEPQVVVGGPTNDLAPMVSPDGTTVAFIRDPGPKVRISPSNDPVDLYTAPLSGASQPGLVASDVCRCQPAWSPDGTRIATWTPDFSILRVVTVDGASPQVDIPSPGNVGLLSWRPLTP